MILVSHGCTANTRDVTVLFRHGGGVGMAALPISDPVNDEAPERGDVEIRRN